jgi:hypothetical protein
MVKFDMPFTSSKELKFASIPSLNSLTLPIDLPQDVAGLTALLHASIATQHEVIQSAKIQLEQFIVGELN